MRKTRLSVYEMKQLEERLAAMELSSILGEEHIVESNIAEKLKLQVCYVDASALSKDKKATLSPPIESGYNGLIKILKNNKTADKNFSYMHEIVHYLFDVGIGNIVTKEYTRKVKGKTGTIEEQNTNYLAAAILIPINSILSDLKYYDDNRRTIDEIKFVHDLMSKYNQSRTAIFRRIKEARELSLIGV